ncbi:hypothetical protein [Umezawaea sp. Da 62-37]|uniref:hypothetical protein n=1 Tax=Umezawaea sp. Da 62-37 TaxID=3075927 RepID=UPI0028F6CB0D|nr:hypothetical protein [Umezawaea sp. Da 62-37]WNV88712.1 hypothetical protein RM788_10550 [Umezawaea sp. Da 62-37]
MSARMKSALCAITALAGLVLVAPQATAQAAYPTNTFRVSYGASYAQGTMTWFNRTVRLTGDLRTLSSSGCRKAYAATFDSAVDLLGERNTSAKCGDAVRSFQLDVPADVVGGAYATSVCLLDANGVVLGDCVAYFRGDAG